MNVSRATTRTAARCALALSVALACTVAAAADFNPNDGTGLVHKNEVQGAFSWNNHELQTNAAGITFSYEAHVNYAAVCTFPMGKRVGSETSYYVMSTGMNVTHRTNQDPKTKQITRFDLTGFGTTTFQSGSLPELSSRCRSSSTGAHGFWSRVAPADFGSTGGLFVNYGTSKVQLSWP
jgi:hypothetical protein